jgi:hypothetical protein
MVHLSVIDESLGVVATGRSFEKADADRARDDPTTDPDV